ncbi:histidine kinase [Nocardiopsis sp. RSe5-2]|uniref:histidine kinase n=1 Tax=Nocardiopsis endophytica TaxID=3018445 RepID=A0ABT4U6F1_9ACTN|nr:sensor histidine kinase [Nocardiopsis endophytica]MDA2812059.1 histidine kinase [Nocardiopsis endophytica]
MPDDRPRTLLQAMARPGYLLSPWPLRAVLYGITTPLSALLWGIPLGLLGTPWLMLAAVIADDAHSGSPGEIVFLVVFGALLLATAGPLVAVPGAALERLRVRLTDDRPFPTPHREPRRPGLAAWFATRYTEGATWRGLAVLVVTALLFLPITGAVGLLLVLGATMAGTPLLVFVYGDNVSLGPWEVSTLPEAWLPSLAGAAVLAVGAYIGGLAVAAQVELVRFMQRDRGEEALRAELTEVTRSRARLVDAFEAERRRIERDLHDGAQQRLVALSMQLGLARLDLPEGSPTRERIAEAQEQAKRALVELRELVHGIHPQVLTDRGLVAALPELADRCAVPTEVVVELDERPPAHTEATAYFAVAEALANTAKHSGAGSARVNARMEARTLVVEVADDGRGGARVAEGGGLTGLADRAAVADGRILLSSPPGGPTLLRLELPCP